MKVKELVRILSKAEKVLRLYENKTVDEMIEDIYLKLSPANIQYKSNNVTKIKKASNYKKIIDEIRHKEKREIIEYMQRLKKDDFINIAKLLKLKISKSIKKDVMIESIASYFSFINLKQKVDEREKEKLKKFMNSNS